MASNEQRATQLQSRAWLSWSARYSRPVLAGLLLIVVLAGVRAARPAVAGNGPLHRDMLQLTGAFEAVLAVLLVVVWRISRRSPDPGYPAGVLRAGLLRIIPLGMVTVAVLVGLSHLYLHPAHRARRIVVGGRSKLGTPRVLKTVAAQNDATLTYLFYALLALLLLAAIVASLLVIRRRLPIGPAGDLLAMPDDDDASLRDAIESGRRALRSFDDAQAAIIACYVAMETSLASAGAAREAAETPDELLSRAVGSGLLRGAAPERLTALFYEARYSSHALPASARDEAVQALDAISAELARGEESRLSGTSGPGAAP